MLVSRASPSLDFYVGGAGPRDYRDAGGIVRPSYQIRGLAGVLGVFGNPKSDNRSFCLITAVFRHLHLLQRGIEMQQRYDVIVGLQIV